MPASAIQQSGYVPIGGIDQWVQIRGDDARNPVLLFLHGGPGGSALVLGTAWRTWERDFTIVHWDQRGAGRTFAKHGTAGGSLLTIGRMAQDAVEVAEFVRGRLPLPRIILAGHSWGTVLGLTAVRARPELFGAYVGVAQVTSTRRNGALRHRKIVAWLRDHGKAEAASRLEQIGPPPYGGAHAKWAAFQQAADLLPFDPVEPKLPRPLPPDIPPAMPELIGRGMMFSRQQIMANGEFEHVDLPALGLKFDLPIFLFSGADDHATPIELAEEFFGRVEAPHKEFVRFDGAGHFFLFNTPEQFFARLLARVRPWALGQGGSPAPTTGEHG